MAFVLRKLGSAQQFPKISKKKKKTISNFSVFVFRLLRASALNSLQRNIYFDAYQVRLSAELPITSLVSAPSITNKDSSCSEAQ